MTRLSRPSPAFLAAASLAAMLAGAGHARAQAPTVAEPGYVVESFSGCTAHEHNALVRTPLPVVRSCTPAAWGPERLALGVHEVYAEVLLASPPAQARIFHLFGEAGRVHFRDLEPTPPGWPWGSMLYVALQDGPVPDHITGFVGIGITGGTWDRFSQFSLAGSIGELAPDPHGAPGGDVVFYFGQSLYRKDHFDNLTLFQPSASGGLQVGPGGDWGTGLYTSTEILAPDGSSRPSPLPHLGPWAFGPGFGGDMFAACGPGEVCRIKADGTETLFASGLSQAQPLFCAGALWFFEAGSGDCMRIRSLVEGSTSTFSPPVINARAKGGTFAFRTTLRHEVTGDLLDPTLMEPAWISRIHFPSQDVYALPEPSADPGCDSATQDGIWENIHRRRVRDDGSMEIVFDRASDGDCTTLDGNRRDLLKFLIYVRGVEPLTVCYRSSHPDLQWPIEQCAQTTVRQLGRGNLLPAPLDLDAGSSFQRSRNGLDPVVRAVPE